MGGLQDLAKSRALLSLVKSLEDQSFRVLLQPRAGLDYFSADEERAKAQLAAVTALMDDIEPPRSEQSPPPDPCGRFSEGSRLATPDVIDESIRITSYTLRKYRELRRKGWWMISARILRCTNGPRGGLYATPGS